MTAGRKAKPAALKELTGRDHHGKKPQLVELDIDVTVKSIEGTYDYTPSLREIWNSLSAGGVVKPSDRRTFQRYEHLTAVYATAAKDIIDRGLILNKGERKECINPSWRTMRDANQELIKIEIEFGLTPSSKRRVLQPAEAKESEENDYETRRAEALRERHSRREFG